MVISGSGLVTQTQRTATASFNTTSPTIESLSPISGFATVGGESFIYSCKEYFGDIQSLRVLIGLGVQSHYECTIISVEYPVLKCMHLESGAQCPQGRGQL